MKLRDMANAQKYWKALEGANSVLILFALKEIGVSTINDIGVLASKELGEYLSTSSTRNRLEALRTLGFVKYSDSKGKAKHAYELTKEGLRMVEALKRFIEFLEAKEA